MQVAEPNRPLTGNTAVLINKFALALSASVIQG